MRTVGYHAKEKLPSSIYSTQRTAEYYTALYSAVQFNTVQYFVSRQVPPLRNYWTFTF